MINLTFPDRGALTGTHGIQIHEVGRCEPPNFASAGGILNPFGKPHGLLNPSGPMAGDVPSLVIGPAHVAVYNTAAPLVRPNAAPPPLLTPPPPPLPTFVPTPHPRTHPTLHP